MAYYRICRHCGCSLDPGEACDCRNEQAEEAGGKEAQKGGGMAHEGSPAAAGRMRPGYGGRAARAG